MTNQENIIRTIQIATSTSGLDYNRAIFALATFRSLSYTDFNSALIAILKNSLSSARNDLSGLLAEYSAVHFDGNVNSINDLTL